MLILSRSGTQAPLWAAILLSLSSITQAQPASSPAYPDWSVQWNRIGGLSYPPESYAESGLPPLKPEYQAIWERP